MTMDQYDELRPVLNKLITELIAESTKKRIEVMKLTSDESPLEIIKDEGSWCAGYHAGVDYAITKIKVSKFYREITGQEDLLY